MGSSRKYFAEFIGTFVLVFIGCGTAASIGCDVAGGYLATAFAFGLAIVAMAYSIGNISGCHVNPAVSLALYMRKDISLKEFVGYIAGQVLGAFAASFVLMLILGAESGLGANALYENNASLSFLIETILTFIFVLTINYKKSVFREQFIGLSLTLVHIIGISLTGTSVNPARSLAPAVLSGNLAGLWVFLLAPLVGAFLAAVCDKYILNAEEE